MKDICMADIPRLNVANLIFPLYTNFTYAGNILETMITEVPMSNDMISIYKNILKFNKIHVPTEHQAIINFVIIMK